MSTCRLGYFRYIAGAHIHTNNSGLLPRDATKKICFIDNQTGQRFERTDLELTKYKRSKMFNEFLERYNSLFKENKISILLAVAYVEQYPSITSAFEAIKKRLQRHKNVIYGYVWSRDVGKSFRPHYHIIVVINPIEEEKLQEIFGNKYHKIRKDVINMRGAVRKVLRCNKSNTYIVMPCRYLRGFIKNYLLDKELYAPKGKRAFGCSINKKTPVIKQLNAH